MDDRQTFEETRTRQKEDQEVFMRLSAPRHTAFGHFREHQKVEGYTEYRDVPDFLGCDRLLKLDHLYGTVQLGYNPQRRQSFLFANIKTSIFDTAASRYQRELKEHQMMRARKEGTQNLLYSSKRREDTAVLLYKAENKPWTEWSIRPYLQRMNQGALRKTLPFLEREEEADRLREGKGKKKELERKIADHTAMGMFDELQALRAQEMALSREQDALRSLLTRKARQSLLFFRSINYAFDIQKQEMFDFYRELREKHGHEEKHVPEEPPKAPTDKGNEGGSGYE